MTSSSVIASACSLGRLAYLDGQKAFLVRADRALDAPVLIRQGQDHLGCATRRG
jgi:hypothetical protein